MCNSEPMSDTKRVETASSLILTAILHLEGVQRSLNLSNSPLAGVADKVLRQLNEADMAVCDLHKALEEKQNRSSVKKV